MPPKARQPQQPSPPTPGKAQTARAPRRSSVVHIAVDTPPEAAVTHDVHDLIAPHITVASPSPLPGSATAPHSRSSSTASRHTRAETISEDDSSGTGARKDSFGQPLWNRTRRGSGTNSKHSTDSTAPSLGSSPFSLTITGAEEMRVGSASGPTPPASGRTTQPPTSVGSSPSLTPPAAALGRGHLRSPQLTNRTPSTLSARSGFTTREPSPAPSRSPSSVGAGRSRRVSIANSEMSIGIGIESPSETVASLGAEPTTPPLEPGSLILAARGKPEKRSSVSKKKSMRQSSMRHQPGALHMEGSSSTMGASESPGLAGGLLSTNQIFASFRGGNDSIRDAPERKVSNRQGGSSSKTRKKPTPAPPLHSGFSMIGPDNKTGINIVLVWRVATLCMTAYRRFLVPVLRMRKLKATSEGRDRAAFKLQCWWRRVKLLRRERRRIAAKFIALRFKGVLSVAVMCRTNNAAVLQDVGRGYLVRKAAWHQYGDFRTRRMRKIVARRMQCIYARRILRHLRFEWDERAVVCAQAATTIHSLLRQELAAWRRLVANQHNQLFTIAYDHYRRAALAVAAATRNNSSPKLSSHRPESETRIDSAYSLDRLLDTGARVDTMKPRGPVPLGRTRGSDESMTGGTEGSPDNDDTISPLTSPKGSAQKGRPPASPRSKRLASQRSPPLSTGGQNSSSMFPSPGNNALVHNFSIGGETAISEEHSHATFDDGLGVHAPMLESQFDTSRAEDDATPIELLNAVSAAAALAVSSAGPERAQSTSSLREALRNMTTASGAQSPMWVHSIEEPSMLGPHTPAAAVAAILSRTESLRGMLASHSPLQLAADAGSLPSSEAQTMLSPVVGRDPNVETLDLTARDLPVADSSSIRSPNPPGTIAVQKATSGSGTERDSPLLELHNSGEDHSPLIPPEPNSKSDSNIVSLKTSPMGSDRPGAIVTTGMLLAPPAAAAGPKSPRTPRPSQVGERSQLAPGSPSPWPVGGQGKVSERMDILKDGTLDDATEVDTSSSQTKTATPETGVAAEPTKIEDSLMESPNHKQQLVVPGGELDAQHVETPADNGVEPSPPIIRGKLPPREIFSPANALSSDGFADLVRSALVPQDPRPSDDEVQKIRDADARRTWAQSWCPSPIISAPAPDLAWKPPEVEGVGEPPRVPSSVGSDGGPQRLTESALAKSPVFERAVSEGSSHSGGVPETGPGTSLSPIDQGLAAWPAANPNASSPKASSPRQLASFNSVARSGSSKSSDAMGSRGDSATDGFVAQPMGRGFALTNTNHTNSSPLLVPRHSTSPVVDPLSLSDVNTADPMAVHATPFVPPILTHALDAGFSPAPTTSADGGGAENRLSPRMQHRYTAPTQQLLGSMESRSASPRSLRADSYSPKSGGGSSVNLKRKRSSRRSKSGRGFSRTSSSVSEIDRGPPPKLSDPGMEVEAAFGEFLEQVEALQRKLLEGEILFAMRSIFENVEWALCIAEQQSEIHQLFVPMLDGMRPMWVLERFLRMLHEEEAGRLAIVDEYESTPLIFLNRPLFYKNLRPGPDQQLMKQRKKSRHMQSFIPVRKTQSTRETDYVAVMPPTSPQKNAPSLSSTMTSPKGFLAKQQQPRQTQDQRDLANALSTFTFGNRDNNSGVFGEFGSTVDNATFLKHLGEDGDTPEEQMISQPFNPNPGLDAAAQQRAKAQARRRSTLAPGLQIDESSAITGPTFNAAGIAGEILSPRAGMQPQMSGLIRRGSIAGRRASRFSLSNVASFETFKHRRSAAGHVFSSGEARNSSGRPGGDADLAGSGAAIMQPRVSGPYTGGEFYRARHSIIASPRTSLANKTNSPRESINTRTSNRVSIAQAESLFPTKRHMVERIEDAKHERDLLYAPHIPAPGESLSAASPRSSLPSLAGTVSAMKSPYAGVNTVTSTTSRGPDDLRPSFSDEFGRNVASQSAQLTLPPDIYGGGRDSISSGPHRSSDSHPSNRSSAAGDHPNLLGIPGIATISSLTNSFGMASQETMDMQSPRSSSMVGGITSPSQPVPVFSEFSVEGQARERPRAAEIAIKPRASAREGGEF